MKIALAQTEALGGARVDLHEGLGRELADGHARVERTELSADERLTESLLMGLRLAEGVARERFRAETGGDFEARLNAARLTELIDAGLLALDARALRATDDGRQRLDAVLARLLG